MTWLQYAALTWKPAFSIGKTIHVDAETRVNESSNPIRSRWRTELGGSRQYQWLVERLPRSRGNM